MPTLAHTDSPGLADTVPTGAVYRLAVNDETRVEQLDTKALLGSLEYRSQQGTETTLRRDPLIAYMTSYAMRLGVLFGAGIGLIGSPGLPDTTPYTIEPAHAGVISPETREPAPKLAGHEEPAAYRAFKDLGRWLDAGDAQVAEMVGVGRTTPYTWVREGREPRPATAQRVYEHHATLDSLRRRLGAAGLRRWLHEGVPTRRETLLDGGLVSLERDVHELLFRRPAERRMDLAAAPEDVARAATTLAAEPAQPSGRRARRPAG